MNMVSKNKTGQVILNIVFILLSVIAVAPFVLLIASSLTDEQALIANGYCFWPSKFSLYSYEYLFRSSGKIIRGLGISVVVTVVGTFVAVMMTLLLPIPFPEKKCPSEASSPSSSSLPCCSTAVWFLLT